MPSMVFHVPFALQENPSAASALRPVKMLAAFRELGYDVHLISGTAKQRRKTIKELKQQLKNGLKIDFVYSEAATIPTSFTEPKHFPLVPFLDAQLFRYLHKTGAKIGLFYRDVYWANDDYTKRVGPLVSKAMRMLYQWDLTIYNRYVSVLFLPSLEMAQEIPRTLKSFPEALPPGSSVVEVSGSWDAASESGQSPVKLFYVGAVSPEHYDITELLKALKHSSSAQLTICTPQESWQQSYDYYQAELSDNVKVVHLSANQLDPEYQNSDIALAFVKPQHYRSFAVPVKIFEYLGRAKPIIVSSGTKAAEIISESDAGWVLDYSADELTKLLDQLQNDRQQIQQKSRNAAASGKKHSWLSRAQQVAQTLSD